MPVSTTLGARVALALVLAASTALIWTNIFPGVLAATGLSHRQAQGLTFYVLTALAFLSFARVSRARLALAAVYLAAGVELAQWATSHRASLRDLAWGLAGITAAWIPGQIETLRRRARRGPAIAGPASPGAEQDIAPAGTGDGQAGAPALERRWA